RRRPCDGAASGCACLRSAGYPRRRRWSDKVADETRAPRCHGCRRDRGWRFDHRTSASRPFRDRVSVGNTRYFRAGPGDHFFEEFHVNTDSVIVTVMGGARVFVRTAVAFRAPFVDPTGAITPVLFGFGGTSDLVLEADFAGTVIAPEAAVRMGTSNAQSFSGSVRARAIELRNNADFTCIPLPCVGTACDSFAPDSCADGIQTHPSAM